MGKQRGQVTSGDSQLWSYAGKAGETLTIRVNADLPCNQDIPAGCLDTWFTVFDPDGAVITLLDYYSMDPGPSDNIEFGVNTDSLVEDLVLPVDGIYWIEVSGSGYQTGGAYTLTIESTPPEVIAPTSGP